VRRRPLRAILTAGALLVAGVIGARIGLVDGGDGDADAMESAAGIPTTTEPERSTTATARLPATGTVDAATAQRSGIWSPAAPSTRAPEIVPDPLYLFEKADDGEPIRWPACTPMHWRYNPAGEPSSGAIEVVRGALSEISAAAGIQMIDDGVTSIDVSDPDQDDEVAEGEVVIGFAPPGSPPIQRSGSPDDASSSESSAFVWGSARARWRGSDITRAVVALNSEVASKLPLDFNSRNSLGAVLLHEIGHVVGLQHVGASTQIMATAQPQHPHGHLGTGDLAGLATLRNRPCKN